MLAITLNLEGIGASSFANGTGVLCTIYTITENGDVCSSYSSERKMIAMDSALGDEMKSAVNTVIQTANKREAVHGGAEKAFYFARDGEVQTVIRRNNSGREVVSCIAPLIAKDGTCCTALEVSCHANSLLNAMTEDVLGTLLMFLMTAASIVIVSDELVRSGSVYLRYRKMREEGVEWAEILMGRPLCFAINLAFSMDAAFAVVIAKDMVANSGMESTPILLGVPALAITMGAAIGTLVHAVMCSRVAGRLYAMPMLLLGIAAQLLCLFAMGNAILPLFSYGLYEGLIRCRYEGANRKIRSHSIITQLLRANVLPLRFATHRSEAAPALGGVICPSSCQSQACVDE